MLFSAAIVDPAAAHGTAPEAGRPRLRPHFPVGTSVEPSAATASSGRPPPRLSPPPRPKRPHAFGPQALTTLRPHPLVPFNISPTIPALGVLHRDLKPGAHTRLPPPPADTTNAPRTAPRCAPLARRSWLTHAKPILLRSRVPHPPWESILQRTSLFPTVERTPCSRPRTSACQPSLKRGRRAEGWGLRGRGRPRGISVVPPPFFSVP